MMTRRQALKTMALSAAALGTGPQLVLGVPPATPATAAKPSATTGPYTLPPLPYAYDALEPHLDAQTMQIHHDKHHAAYVANLNKAVADQPALGAKSVEALIGDLAGVPEAIRTAVRNHGGGHANHSLFWTSLKKGASDKPAGNLARDIDRAFGSFDGFREKFSAAATSVFGSGWAWLSLAGGNKLVVETTPNQDSPLMSGHTPLLGIDVWEHAYYLKYQNRRADYVSAFANVVDWEAVAERYARAIRG